MKYPAFELAAQRHLESCRHIMTHFAPTKTAKDIRLLWNTYYLSGYVIECSLKYAFFKCTFDRNIDIKEFTYGIYTYEKLQTHQLDILKTYLIAVDSALSSDDIPFLTQSIGNQEHRALVNRWNSEIRYSTDFARFDFTFNQNLIENYLSDVVKPIFDKLTKR
jgi:hypothetical protein